NCLEWRQHPFRSSNACLPIFWKLPLRRYLWPFSQKPLASGELFSPLCPFRLREFLPNREEQTLRVADHEFRAVVARGRALGKPRAWWRHHTSTWCHHQELIAAVYHFRPNLFHADLKHPCCSLADYIQLRHRHQFPFCHKPQVS